MSLCDFGDTLFIYTEGTSHGAAREGEKLTKHVSHLTDK